MMLLSFELDFVFGRNLFQTFLLMLCHRFLFVSHIQERVSPCILYDVFFLVTYFKMLPIIIVQQFRYHGCKINDSNMFYAMWCSDLLLALCGLTLCKVLIEGGSHAHKYEHKRM